MTEVLTEKTALDRMRRGDESGLAWFIRRYTAYVSAIVWNLAGHVMTVQDAEEITADVFLTLWRYCENPAADKAKGYLGAIARTRTLNWLKRAGLSQALEYDEVTLTADSPERAVLEREAKQALRQAVEAMGPPDREIFIRHYYYGESSAVIADALGLTAANVRKRLERGREALRQRLEKGERTHDDH